MDGRLTLTRPPALAVSAGPLGDTLTAPTPKVALRASRRLVLIANLQAVRGLPLR